MHAEVSDAAKPDHAELKTTEPQWGPIAHRTPSQLTLKGVHCVLSELQQNPITPNSKRPTCDRAP